MSNPTFRPAYNHEPDRKSPTFCVDALKAYANTERKRDESGTVNCATFRMFNRACGVIATESKIRKTLVYPGLRELGRRQRYADMKAGNPDVLWQLHELVEPSMQAFPAIREYAENGGSLFPERRTVTYRINLNAIEEAKKTSEGMGVEMSELNLFDALSGLELLVQTDPLYDQLKDDPDIKWSIRRLEEIRENMMGKISVLERLCGR